MALETLPFGNVLARGWSSIGQYTTAKARAFGVRLNLIFAVHPPIAMRIGPLPFDSRIASNPD